MKKEKIEKLYYSISEVSKITGLKQYVLRFWETEFPMLKPRKNRAGNRTYRQTDIDTILRIKDFLYVQKYTIDGARDRIKSGTTKDLSDDRDSIIYREVLKKVKEELLSLLKQL